MTFIAEISINSVLFFLGFWKVGPGYIPALSYDMITKEKKITLEAIIKSKEFLISGNLDKCDVVWIAKSVFFF